MWLKLNTKGHHVHHVLLLCFVPVFFWPLQLFCVFLVLQMSMLMLLCELWLWLCTYAGRMTTILEVQDEIHKVQGELEELRKRLQEEVPEAERAHLWKKEELLMKEKEQLRQKELLLMQSGQNSTALVQQAGHNNNSLVQQPAQNTPISSTFSFPLQFAKPVCVPQLDLASIFDVLCSLMTACCWWNSWIVYFVLLGLSIFGLQADVSISFCHPPDFLLLQQSENAKVLFCSA